MTPNDQNVIDNFKIRVETTIARLADPLLSNSTNVG